MGQLANTTIFFVLIILSLSGCLNVESNKRNAKESKGSSVEGASFNIGDRVSLIRNADVYDGPGQGSSAIQTQAMQGEIKSNKIDGGWYNIDFDSGRDGYVQDQNFELAKNSPTSPIVPPTPSPLPAPVASLLSSQTQVQIGSSIILSWNTTNAQSCSASGSNNFLGNIPLSGSRSLSPNSDTTYSINCQGQGGSVFRSVRVIVTQPIVISPTPPNPSPVISISSSPSSIQNGETSILSWDVQNANSCEAQSSSPSNFNGTISLTGSKSISPSSTTTYTLTCFGGGGKSSGVETVIVSQQSPQPTLSFEASLTQILSGQSITLTWSSQDSDTCTANGSSDFNGPVSLNGLKSVSPTTKTTYTLTCQGSGGKVTKNITVNISQVAPPVVSLSATPSTIQAGESSELSWSSQNATSCSASGDSSFSGAIALSGSQSVSPATTRDFTVTCQNSGGSVASSTTITVQTNTPPTNQTLAFPTAEGFGKHAKGGRGGDVYIVSNLNDSGSGSLRECVEASGPRTCVFAVSGEIRVNDAIRARNPYLTIAGQTAPGDGIMLTIRNTPSVNYPLAIQTSHVIIRHIRVRPGPSQQKSDNVDAILVSGRGATDIILDHVTMSWGTDETLNFLGNSGTTNRALSANTERITVQWSMIYETLRNSTHTSQNHSRSTYLGYGVQDISFHHNIIANNTRRNPNLGTTGQTDFINNILYNSSQYHGEIYNRHGTNNLNYVGNIAIAGPDTPKKSTFYSLDLFLNQDLGTLNLYLKDNIDINRLNYSQDEKLVINPNDWGYVRNNPVGYGTLSLPASSITNADQAYLDVLAYAGTIRPNRDSADTRFVNEVRGCQGKIIDHPSQSGGWPTLNSTTAPTDTDKDGIPDSYETSQGWDPSNAVDRNSDADRDGYTNLEEYLNDLAGDNDGIHTGKGSGAKADPTCGSSIASSSQVNITKFDIQPRAVRPGEQVTITWDSENAGTCQRSWDRGGDPFLVSGTQTISLDQTTQFDFTCTANQRTDWINISVFVTPDGNLPVPEIIFTSSSGANPVNAGDAVTLTWNTEHAGECRASGAWSGIKTAKGSETLPAAAGAYKLTCTGPGGSQNTELSLSVQ